MECYFENFEIFKVIKKYSEIDNFKLALIIRNLPINFAEKNYLQCLSGISKRNFYITSTLDALFRISFYTFIGSSL